MRNIICSRVTATTSNEIRNSTQTYMIMWIYICQTRRNLLSRIKQHATSQKSEVCKHLLQNPTHRVDFITTTILSSKNDTASLLIVESLFIQEQTSDLNTNSQSSPLIIFNTELYNFILRFIWITSQFTYFCCHVII